MCKNEVVTDDVTLLKQAQAENTLSEHLPFLNFKNNSGGTSFAALIMATTAS